MRFRNVLCRRSAHIVAVHEDRHVGIPSLLQGVGPTLSVVREQVLRVKFSFDGGEPFGVTQVGSPNAILVVLRYEVYVSAARRERGGALKRDRAQAMQAASSARSRHRV